MPAQFTKEELAAARKRLDAQSDRGSDEEYNAALLDDLFAFGRMVARNITSERSDEIIREVRAMSQAERDELLRSFGF